MKKSRFKSGDLRGDSWILSGSEGAVQAELAGIDCKAFLGCSGFRKDLKFGRDCADSDIWEPKFGDGGDGGVQGSCVRRAGDGCELRHAIRACYGGAGVHDFLRHSGDFGYVRDLTLGSYAEFCIVAYSVVMWGKRILHLEPN